MQEKMLFIPALHTLHCVCCILRKPGLGDRDINQSYKPQPAE